MSPADINAAFRSGAISRTVADALQKLLTSITHHPMREPSTGEVYVVESEDDRKEIIQLVWLKLLVIHGVPVDTDAKILSYLESMLVRALINIHRRAFDELIPERHAAPSNTSHEEEQQLADWRRKLARGRELLEKAFAYALTVRAPRYRDGLAEAFAQVKQLVFDRVAMEAIILRTAGPGESPSVVRNRLFKAHERCRRELARAIEELTAAGEISWEDAQLLQKLQRGLLRCQRKDTSPSSPSEGDAHA